MMSVLAWRLKSQQPKAQSLPAQAEEGRPALSLPQGRLRELGCRGFNRCILAKRDLQPIEVFRRRADNEITIRNADRREAAARCDSLREENGRWL
jgi:hypothetical protein